jgi:hypothetical protein
VVYHTHGQKSTPFHEKNAGGECQFEEVATDVSSQVFQDETWFRDNYNRDKFFDDSLHSYAKYIILGGIRVSYCASQQFVFDGGFLMDLALTTTCLLLFFGGSVHKSSQF